MLYFLYWDTDEYNVLLAPADFDFKSPPDHDSVFANCFERNIAMNISDFYTQVAHFEELDKQGCIDTYAVGFVADRGTLVLITNDLITHIKLLRWVSTGILAENIRSVLLSGCADSSNTVIQTCSLGPWIVVRTICLCSPYRGRLPCLMRLLRQISHSIKMVSYKIFWQLWWWWVRWLADSQIFVVRLSSRERLATIFWWSKLLEEQLLGEEYYNSDNWFQMRRRHRHKPQLRHERNSFHHCRTAGRPLFKAKSQWKVSIPIQSSYMSHCQFFFFFWKLLK